MPKYVVDTHALLWYTLGMPQLSQPARAVLDDAANTFVVSIIAIAEACWLIERGKMNTHVTHSLLLAVIDSDSRFEIVSLTREIVMRSLKLTSLEMHDRLIVATALTNSCALISKDEAIQQSGFVQIVW